MAFQLLQFFNGLGLEVVHDLPLSLDRYIQFSLCHWIPGRSTIGKHKGNRICRCLAVIDVTGSNTERNVFVPAFAAEGSQECSKVPKI